MLAGLSLREGLLHTGNGVLLLLFSPSVVLDSLRPHDSSLPGSSARGISQARTLEWVAIFFPRGSSQPRD